MIGFNLDKEKGIFLKDVLNEFEKKEEKIKIKRIYDKNTMILLIEVKPEDIRKEIYFFDKNKDRKQGFLKEIEKRKKDIKIVKPSHKEEDEEELAFDTKFKPDIDGNYSIEIEFKGRINDCSYMFYGCSNIFYADLSNFDLPM